MEQNIENQDIKDVVTKNLVKYRKANKLTQIELAEKLQYSDKNISKWERGDSLPDLIVLKQIADIYGITVNDLMTPSEEVAVKTSTEQGTKKRNRFFNKQQFLIFLLSIGIVWLAATLVFAVSNVMFPDAENLWHIFIVALPICFIVLLVFTSIWCTNLMDGIAVSLLIWTIALAFNICVPIPDSWLIYIVAIPIQILDILWFSFRKINKVSLETTPKAAKKQEIDEEHN